MAVDKPSVPNSLLSSEMNSNAPTLPTGFACNAQNWLVMQPVVFKVVGNGYLQTDLDGKNKKALYLQANNRAFKTLLDG